MPVIHAVLHAVLPAEWSPRPSQNGPTAPKKLLHLIELLNMKASLQGLRILVDQSHRVCFLPKHSHAERVDTSNSIAICKQ